MNAIPLSKLLVLPLTKGFGPPSSKAHPGAAGKDNELELRRQNIQCANCTLNHVAIDLGFRFRFMLLFIGWWEVRQNKISWSPNRLKPSIEDDSINPDDQKRTKVVCMRDIPNICNFTFQKSSEILH